nr:heat shock protein 1 [Drosophila melanogaster]
MSLIPFILDLAEELHDFNRSLAMDIDDSAGFGLYPLEATSQLPQLSRGVGAWECNDVGAHQGSVGGHRSIAIIRTIVWPEPRLLAAISRWWSWKRNWAIRARPGQAARPVANGASKSAYSVVNRNGFQVSMNVKQFAANELTVKTIDNCIVVEGQHDEKEDGHGVISRHFIRKYILPKGYDPNEVHSTLSSDGILTVKAPQPLPVVKGSLERQERIVDIQQISQQQKDKDAHRQSRQR